MVPAAGRAVTKCNSMGWTSGRETGIDYVAGGMPGRNSERPDTG